MPIYLGGLRITNAAWLSTTGLRVDFVTNYDDRYYQLYAGRTLVGVTQAIDDTHVVAVLKPSLYPQYLQLVAVEQGQQQTDFGAQLPQRPYNKVRLGFLTAFTAAEFVRVTASPAPGQPVSAANILENILFDTDRAYTYVSPPLSGSGTWEFEAAGIDLAGNIGEPLPFTAAGLLAIPPDLQLRADGRRLTSQSVDGITTISFSYSNAI